MKEMLQQLKNMMRNKSILCALAIFCIYAVICGAKNKLLLFFGLAFIVIYIAAMYFILKSDSRSEGVLTESSKISGITLDFVMSFNSPAIAVNDSGIIIWYNKAFIAVSQYNKSMYGRNIADVVSNTFTSQRIEQMKAGAVITLDYNNVTYDVSGYKLNSHGKSYCMTVWNDKTELLNTKRELEESNLIVCFVMIDNISEVMPYIQEKYRTVSVHVAELLDSWCETFGGIIKEYEKDKYMVILEEKNLSNVISSKFDILDKIRETTLNDINIPITASIGLAKIKGSLSEKENTAKRALELALQRGGDQAVVKTESSTEYYGGKTKTVQKKTKIRSRIVAGDLVNLIKESSNVLVMGHKFADHDCIAACMAAARIAISLGKTANVIVNIHDANLKPIFSKMLKSSIYPDLFTDNVSAQDTIRSDTLLIICDVNNPVHFEAPDVYENCKNVVIIDHHRKTQEFEKVPVLAYIEPSASSASELMCEILEQAVQPGTLAKTEAELLFAGMLLDTKNFTKNTGVRTFGAALYLRGEGADPNEARKLFRTSVSDFLREIKFESNVIIYKDSIAIAAYGGESNSSDKIAAAKAADKLLEIEGVDAAFVACAIGSNVHISARSNGKINVQLILEEFEGGGHFDAAGAQISDTDITSALNLLKQAIDKYLS